MTDHTPSTRPYADPADRFIDTDIGFDFYEKATGELRTIRHVPAPTQEIGAYVREKQGFYEGRWQPKDKDGVPYGTLLDIYSSPEDLTDKKGQRLVTSFKKAVKATAKVKNFYGRDGAGFKNEDDLIKAVKAGDTTKLQKLWIPTKDILRDMLFDNRTTEKIQQIEGMHWSSTLAGIESQRMGENPKDWVYAIDMSLSKRSPSIAQESDPAFNGNREEGKPVRICLVPRVGGSTYKSPKSEYATRPVWAELVAEF
jgi:hypothetical protein